MLVIRSTAAQMRALFGCGLHPLAELRLRSWKVPTSLDTIFGT